MKPFTYQDFSETKEDAARLFLSLSRNIIRSVINLHGDELNLFSAGYLCHLAFELLFKGLNLYYCGYYSFERKSNGHKLSSLREKLKYKVNLGLSKSDSNLLDIIDTFNLLKYPVEKALNKPDLLYKKIPIGIGEIGSQELVDSINLYNKIWIILKGSKMGSLIKYIEDNPQEVGSSILMRKLKK